MQETKVQIIMSTSLAEEDERLMDGAIVYIESFANTFNHSKALLQSGLTPLQFKKLRESSTFFNNQLNLLREEKIKSVVNGNKVKLRSQILENFDNLKEHTRDSDKRLAMLANATMLNYGIRLAETTLKEERMNTKEEGGLSTIIFEEIEVDFSGKADD